MILYTFLAVTDYIICLAIIEDIIDEKKDGFPKVCLPSTSEALPGGKTGELTECNE